MAGVFLVVSLTVWQMWNKQHTEALQTARQAAMQAAEQAAAQEAARAASAQQRAAQLAAELQAARETALREQSLRAAHREAPQPNVQQARAQEGDKVVVRPAPSADTVRPPVDDGPGVADPMARRKTFDFRAMDADGDGYLSRQEVQGRPLLPQAFEQADANGDGRISLPEFLNFRPAGARPPEH
jgi:hypothetical protein